MKKLKDTLKDIELVAKRNSVKYLITRFDSSVKNVSDLDVLVNPKHFKNMVGGLVKLGYRTKSHDHALGGRLSGYQINIIKKGKIKIDLHKDFTWRAKKYIDLELVWKKEKLIDPFLVFISIIFEKTYIDFEDYKYVWKYKKDIFNNVVFLAQAKKYKWQKTFNNIKNWNPNNFNLPLFIPVSLVIASYFEKFNFVSLLYYLFFRVRYFFTKQLPYD